MQTYLLHKTKYLCLLTFIIRNYAHSGCWHYLEDGFWGRLDDWDWYSRGVVQQEVFPTFASINIGLPCFILERRVHNFAHLRFDKQVAACFTKLIPRLKAQKCKESRLDVSGWKEPRILYQPLQLMGQESESRDLLLFVHLLDDHGHAVCTGSKEFHGQREEKRSAARALDSSRDCYEKGQLPQRECLGKGRLAYR
jgi:hypothetical protein